MFAMTKALESYQNNRELFGKIILAVGLVVIILDCILLLAAPHLSHQDILINAVLLNITGWSLYPLWIGALLNAQVQLDQQREVTFQESLVYGWQQWWKIMALEIFLGIFIFLPMTADYFKILLPGAVVAIYYIMIIYMLSRYILIMPVMLLEKQSLPAACRRSASLSQQSRIGIIAELIMLFIMIKVFVYILQIPLAMIIQHLVRGSFDWIMVLFNGLINPLLYAVLVIWIYYTYRQCQQNTDRELPLELPQE